MDRDRRPGSGGIPSGGVSEPPLCLSCLHYNEASELTCKAFPAGIPRAILLNGHDHRRPFPGDGGILYAPSEPGEPDPDPFAEDE